MEKEDKERLGTDVRKSVREREREREIVSLKEREREREGIRLSSRLICSAYYLPTYSPGTNQQ